jgi:hypothetical protein
MDRREWLKATRYLDFNAPRFSALSQGITSGQGNNSAGHHSMGGGVRAPQFYGQSGTGSSQLAIPRELRAGTSSTGTI